MSQHEIAQLPEEIQTRLRTEADRDLQEAMHYWAQHTGGTMSPQPERLAWIEKRLSDIYQDIRKIQEKVAECHEALGTIRVGQQDQPKE